MCRTHIFKLLIMYAIRNMCRTHIFKVVYKRRPHFLADDCSFPDCPVLWTPRFYYLSGFVDTALFTVCPVLWTLPIQCSAKFHNIGISDNAILSVKDRLLLNILVFTPNFPISQQRKIPEYWNFRQRNFERERQAFAKYHCFHAEFFYQPAA